MSEMQQDPKQQSTAELTGHLTELVPRLVRDELTLARLEVPEKGRRDGLGAAASPASSD